ncbi:MAG: trypsin-like peptidase domain-containing protein [Pseudomonadota bacterium]
MHQPVYSYADAIDRARPSVVNIFTLKSTPSQNSSRFRFQRPRNRTSTDQGSGIIISENGLIITNYHVIEGARSFLVELLDGRRVDAKLVGTDAPTDLALLKIELENLPAIPIAPENMSRVGDVVFAIGHPYGASQTVTMGIISATGRKYLRLAQYEDFIQTDAAINPGNSGGALVNAKGELIGIASGFFSEQVRSDGIAFAIPIELSNFVTEEILNNGRVIRGWVGITAVELNIRQISELNLNLAQPQYVTIARIEPNSPADLAGLKVNDIITRVDNKLIRNPPQIFELVASYRPGLELEFRVLRKTPRGYYELSLNPKLIERPN